MPGIYRAQVWQLLLGVFPVYTTSTEWVWRERVEQFRESERALTVTKKITKDTDKNTRITIIWLMENNKLKVGPLAVLYKYIRMKCNVPVIFISFNNIYFTDKYVQKIVLDEIVDMKKINFWLGKYEIDASL